MRRAGRNRVWGLGALPVLAMLAGALPAGTTAPRQADETLQPSWGAVEAVSRGTARAYRPEAVVDSLGLATVVWEQGGHVWAARRPHLSPDGGWQEPQRLGPGGFPVVDADADGRVTVAWRGPRGAVLVARWRPGCGWSRRVQVSPPFPRTGDRVAWPPEIDVGDAGAVAVVTTWGVYRDPGWKVRVAYRAPGGRWRTSDVTRFGPHVGDPHVAVDPEGNVDLAFTRKGVVTLRREIGQGWGRPVRLTHQRFGPQGIAVGPDGRAVIAWYQRVPGQGWESYASVRGAPGWAAPARISEEGRSVVVADLAVDGRNRATVALDRRYHRIEVVDRPAGSDWGSPAPVWRWTEGRLWQRPVLAVNASGQALMAWVRKVEVGDDVWDLYAEAAYRSGDTWGPAERLTPEGAGRPGAVATAVAPDGSALLVWEHWSQEERSTRIVARSLMVGR